MRCGPTNDIPSECNRLGVWLFAVHPVLVTTVSYPIQQSVIMATLACGWAFLCYDSKQYVRCFILCIICAMCKQNAWVFPAVLAVYEWLVKRKRSVVTYKVGYMTYERNHTP